MRNTTKQFLALTLLAVFALAPAAAQRVGGQAYGTSVNGTRTGQAVLADTGGFSAADADYASLGGVSVDGLTSLTTGAVDQKRSSSQSTSQLENVSVLNGLITATTIIASASSWAGWRTTSSNALGSSFTDLVVAGTPVGSGEYTPAPNTRIDLPGVGYAILNEQRQTGDGVSTSGITVNMVRLVTQSPILGPLGTILGYQTTGEYVVGSAASSVSR